MEKYYFRRLGVALYEGRNKDGLSYVLSPTKGVNTKFFGILVPKGGLTDVVEIGGTKIPAGTAHLLEHRLFETVGGDTLKKFSECGAFANAFTTESFTFYYFSTSQDYEKPLDILFSMFNSFYQTSEKIEHEKPIILGEMATRRDDTAYVMDRKIVESLYFSSPIKDEIIGTERSIQSIHLSAARKFFEQYYSADSLTLFASGDFDPDKVIRIVDSAKLPKFKKQPVKSVEYKEKYDKAVRSEVEDVSPDGQTYLGVGIKFPPRKELFEKFGDDMFALYEIAGSLVFSKANQAISDMRRDGLIIFGNGHNLEEAGEDTYLEAFFETNSPEKLKKAFEKHFASLVKSYKSVTSPLNSIQLSYYGDSSMLVSNSEDYTNNLVDAYMNHFAWPALVSRVLAFKKKDVVKFLEELVTFPRTYVVLSGDKTR